MSEFIPTGKPSQAEQAVEMLRTFNQDLFSGKLDIPMDQQVKEELRNLLDPAQAYMKEHVPELEAKLVDAEQHVAATKDYVDRLGEGSDIVEAGRMVVDVDDRVDAAATELEQAQAVAIHVQIDAYLVLADVKEQYVRETLGIQEGSEADLAVKAAMQSERGELTKLEAELDVALEENDHRREAVHARHEDRLAEMEADPEAANERMMQNVHKEHEQLEIRNAVNAVDHADPQLDEEGMA